VRGGDLRHYLNQDKDFSSRQIRLYIAEIAVGLKQLHRLGIIYRDLKPENILLDEKGHIKLADFGLSRELGRDSQGRYSFCGTQEFLAPEMIKEEPQTFALDWWALGVLSYRLIIGCFPFQNDNPKRFFNWIVSRKPLIPKSIEINTESLLRGLLEKNPVHRIGSSGNDITEHPYFADLSWELVEAQAYEPDFRPPMSRDDSCGNFDREFTGQPGCDSFSLGDSCASLSSESDCMNVPGFSYEAETFLQ
jgi:serine/threonine protein kinase